VVFEKRGAGVGDRVRGEEEDLRLRMLRRGSLFYFIFLLKKYKLSSDGGKMILVGLKPKEEVSYLIRQI
jgi:hypothetical protein